MNRRFRVVGRVAAVLGARVLAGATYQGVATALERRQFTRPGGLVSVGDHQLHIHCTGTGAPTVVLEAPAAGMSAAWGLVQPEVARVSRVCSYDRAGLGWSEHAAGPYDPAAAAGELRRLLEAAGEKGPFVVAGQGFGAALARVFAGRYADAAASVVLVDVPEPDAPAGETLVRFAGAWPWLARAGVLRAGGVLSDRAEGLRPPAAGTLATFLNRPDHLTQAARELSRWNEVVTMAAAAAPTTPATHVTTTARGPVAFLTDAPSASAVVSAIVESVTRVRARAGSPIH